MLGAFLVPESIETSILMTLCMNASAKTSPESSLHRSLEKLSPAILIIANVMPLFYRHDVLFSPDVMRSASKVGQVRQAYQSASLGVSSSISTRHSLHTTLSRNLPYSTYQLIYQYSASDHAWKQILESDQQDWLRRSQAIR